MAALFAPVATKFKYSYMDGNTSKTKEFPDLIQPRAAQAALTDEKIGEIIGLQTIEIKNAVAQLARSNYTNYIEYKTQMWDGVKVAVIAHYKESAARWKGLGYTDADALEQASKSTKKYKEELEEWFNELFSAPKAGVEIKNIF